MMFGNVGTSLWRLELFKPNLLVQTLVFHSWLTGGASSPRDERVLPAQAVSSVCSQSWAGWAHFILHAPLLMLCSVPPDAVPLSPDGRPELWEAEGWIWPPWTACEEIGQLAVMDHVNCCLFYIHRYDSLYQNFPQAKMIFLTATSQKTQLVCYVSVIILATCGVLEEAVHGLPSHLFCAVDEFHDRFHGEHFGYFVMFFPSENRCLLREEQG